MLAQMILTIFFVNITENIVKSLSVENRIALDYITKFSNKPLNLNFSFREVTFIENRNAVNSLKNKHSKDIYNMTIPLVKKVINLLIYPLTKLFNRCIRDGTYPSCLKISKIVPVFKKGDPESVNNYRPIALIPTLSKIFFQMFIETPVNTLL